MKIRTVCTVFLCVALLSAVSLAAAHVYQPGKVVKVEKQESSLPSGGTDAPLQASVNRYRVSIQIGDTVYRCRYPSDIDISWVEGKDVEARVSGKVMYVKKPSGKEVKGSIVTTSSAGNP